MERTKAHDARMRPAARLHLLTSPRAHRSPVAIPARPDLTAISFLVSEQPFTQRYDA